MATSPPEPAAAPELPLEQQVARMGLQRAWEQFPQSVQRAAQRARSGAAALEGWYQATWEPAHRFVAPEQPLPAAGANEEPA